MKIGLITFHFASNQGAVLQCYAMQKYLENQGHDVFVIDYQPSYHLVRYQSRKNPFLYARDFWRKFHYKEYPRRVYLTARSFARCIYMNVMHTDSRVEQCFENFRQRYLHTTARYRSLAELKKNPPKMEAYISGSDQLWNPEVLDQNFDKAYFLDFGDENIMRISYAVSIGKEMPEHYLKQLRSLCVGLDAVSLREFNEMVIDAIGKDVHICIDPTFLLTADDYREIEGNISITEPYIFVYGFETNKDILDAIEAAKKKYRCLIVNGSPMRIKYRGNVVNTRDYGPEIFLGYIRNAVCVVTNSFHATAFSVIYEKDFITVPHSTRGMRMKNLLGRLSLRSCLYKDEAFDIGKAVNYASVRPILSEWKRHSEEFLTMALAGKKGEEIPHYTEE